MTFKKKSVKLSVFWDATMCWHMDCAACPLRHSIRQVNGHLASFGVDTQLGEIRWNGPKEEDICIYVYIYIYILYVWKPFESNSTIEAFFSLAKILGIRDSVLKTLAEWWFYDPFQFCRNLANVQISQSIQPQFFCPSMVLLTFWPNQLGSHQRWL